MDLLVNVTWSLAWIGGFAIRASRWFGQFAMEGLEGERILRCVDSMDRQLWLLLLHF